MENDSTTERDYVIRAGDSDYIVWSDDGTIPAGEDERRWNKADGCAWLWHGSNRKATRFTWSEARDVVWNKCKPLNRDGMGNPTTPPRADRWRFTLVRIVPKGDTIRPRRAS